MNVASEQKQTTAVGFGVRVAICVSGTVLSKESLHLYYNV